MTDRPTYPGLRRDGSSPPVEVAVAVNGILAGKLNAVLDVAIEAGADFAAVTDPRLHPLAVVLTPPGSSITGYTLAASVLMLSVIPGPARSEPVVVVG